MDKVIHGHTLEASLQASGQNDPQSLLDNNISRAVPLLRRSLFWSKLLEAYLRGSSICCLLPDFCALSDIDADTAVWLLEHLRMRFDDYKEQQAELIKFHVAIVHQAPRHDVVVATTLNLSLILEKVLDPGEGYLNEVKDSAVDLHTLEKLLPLAESPAMLANREMVESYLRLQGCLLAIDALITRRYKADPRTFDYRIQRWEINLRYALNEEMVS